MENVNRCEGLVVPEALQVESLEPEYRSEQCQCGERPPRWKPSDAARRLGIARLA